MPRIHIDHTSQTNLSDAKFSQDKRWEYVNSLIYEAIQSGKVSDWSKVQEEINTILEDKEYVCKDSITK